MQIAWLHKSFKGISNLLTLSAAMTLQTHTCTAEYGSHTVSLSQGVWCLLWVHMKGLDSQRLWIRTWINHTELGATWPFLCVNHLDLHWNLSKAFFSGTAFHSLNENMSWAQTLLQNKEGRDVKIWHEEKKNCQN